MSIEFEANLDLQPGKPGFSVTEVYKDIFKLFLLTSNQTTEDVERRLQAGLQRAMLAGALYNLTLFQNRHQAQKLDDSARVQETQLLQIWVFLDFAASENVVASNPNLETYFKYLTKRLGVSREASLQLLTASVNL